jgi:hypothetical protein
MVANHRAFIGGSIACAAAIPAAGTVLFSIDARCGCLSDCDFLGYHKLTGLL